MFVNGICKLILLDACHFIKIGVSMSEQNINKKKQEQINEQKSLNKFNSITEKQKPENQNQDHNVRKEGIGPINQKK